MHQTRTRMDSSGYFYKIILSAFLFCTLCTTVRCQDKADTLLSNAANCFTLKLYQLLAKSNKDSLVCSPFSLDVLLSILRSGAGGKTDQELTASLGYSQLSVPEMLKAFQSKMRKLTSSNGNTLEVANSVWIQNNFNVEKNFRDVAIDNFFAEVDNVNFAGDSRGATNRINSWGSNKTRGLIPKLFDKDLDESTIMVLVNAIYFKGKWARQFRKDETTDGDFYGEGSSNKPSKVKLMHQQNSFKYKFDRTLNTQVLEMDYEGGNMSMVIILPGASSDKPAKIGDLESVLTCENFNPNSVSRWETLVDVTLPKFKTESSFNLIAPVKESGMRDMFENSANFSGIAPNIFVSQIIQKAVIKVYEEGSEAAGLSGIAMMASGSVDSGPRIEVFRADRPFLYVIRNKPTNLILFMGRVSVL